MIISKARMSDAESIRECLQAAFKDQIEKTGEVPPLYDDLPKIKDHIEKHIVRVVRGKGNKVVAGYVCYWRFNCLYLSKIFVHPTCQGQGWGKALMYHFEQYNGCYTYFTLHTEANNLKNAEFYSGLGYQCVTEEKVGNVVLSLYVKYHKQED